MLSFSSATSLAFAPASARTPTPVTVTRAAAPVMESLDDLKTMAPKLNPIVGYWNPLGLGESNALDGTSEGFMSRLPAAATTGTGQIGFLRHAEIKHGRIAMAAFVGFIVQENGIFFPWASTGGPSPIMYADIAAAGSPAAQWDAIPTLAKLQILGFIGLLELWGELSGAIGAPHYMTGGKPGAYPSFSEFRKIFKHPPFDLFDPFGLSKNKSPEQKERGLLVELNNGRLAMLGIMGMVSAASVEGSVPLLAGKIKHYDGEVMAPFSAADADSLPFISEMLNYPHLPLF